SIDQRHLGSKPVENGGKLDSDMAAALDEDARRQLFQVKRLVRGNDMFEARDGRPHPRRSAGGDEDVARTDFFSSRDKTYRVGIFQDGAALDELHAGALKRRGIGEFKPRNLAILIGNEARPVEYRFAQRPAVARRVLEFVGKTRGVDEELFRNTAADHA